VRYAWIEDNKGAYAVRFLCHAMKVSVSGFYRWRSRPMCHQKRRWQYMQTEIIKMYHLQKKRYGAPRIARELRAKGLSCSVNYVASILRHAGLRGRNGRSFKYRAAIEGRVNVAPNILKRNFNASRANQKWVADITYVPVRNRWVYLAVVMDLYSRKIVGWQLSRRMGEDLVCSALDMAFGCRRVKRGLIVHSDRGVQYRSHVYKRMLLKKGCVISMSRSGNCWDNAAMESFFSRFKVELVYAEKFYTLQQAKQNIFEYIEIFYNRKRRHSAIGYLSPWEFEKLCA
jgi:transposase InsO family protein